MKTKKTSVNRETWQTTRSERLNYYIGDLGRTLEGYIVTAFMTLFLLFQGINLVKISAAILIVKIIDACDDVIFGFLIDKLNIRNNRLLGKLAGEGKYLPWYRATFFLFPIFTVIFFLMPQEASDALKIGWFMVTYLLYDLSYTLVEVPMNSMIVSLTDNVDERNSILQFKGILSGIFTVLAGVVWMFLVSEHVGFSMRAVAIVSSVIFFIMMLPLATKVKEHNVELKNAENEQETQHYTFRDISAFHGHFGTQTPVPENRHAPYTASISAFHKGNPETPQSTVRSGLPPTAQSARHHRGGRPEGSCF